MASAKEAAAAIERAPEAVLRRLAGGTGGLFDILKRIVKWFFTVGLVIFLALGLLWIVLFGANCQEGGLCGVVARWFGLAIEELRIPQFLDIGILETIKLAANPEELVKPGSPFSFEEQRVEHDEYGIKITRFRPDGFFELGEPISATAAINVKAPDEYDLVIDFSNACSMDGYNGRVEPTGPFTTGKTIRVDSGTTEDFEVGCEFLDGVKEIAKEVEAKTITINPRYEMVQDITWLVGAKNVKSGSDQTIGVTRAISSGPMIISLFSLTSQPFYVNTDYRVHVSLENNKLVWRGRLDRARRIELRVPENVKLLDDDQFCEFKSAGTTEGFNVYTVKDTELEDVNIDCNSRDILLKYSITFDTCINRYKDKTEFSCKFRFNNAEDVISQYPFIAEVSYGYVGEDKTLLTLSKTV